MASLVLAKGIVSVLAMLSSAAVAADDPQAAVDRVLASAKSRGGLCVVLADRDAATALAVAARGEFLVQCLLPDDARVQAAREAIRAKGVYGRVTAERRPASGLPYADNLVNLLIAAGGAPPPPEEMLRVLCPDGVAWLADDQKLTKPRPTDIDEWTHSLHGPDGNPVAADTVVGEPSRVQWIEGPTWQRHHESVASPMGVVSAAGRLFYIVDEAPAAVLGLPDQWKLVARDAFNGVQLWKRPIADWGWKAWTNHENGGRFIIPLNIAKRIVAAGDRLYVTLGYNAPLAALDAATGQTLRTYEGTDFTDEVLYLDGLLILAVNKAAQKPGKIGNDPPVAKQVMVVRADTGEVLWRKGEYIGVAPKTDVMERITEVSLATAGGRICLLDRDEVVALDLKTGEELWRAPRPADNPKPGHVAYLPRNLCTLVATPDVVLFAQSDEGYTTKTWNRGVKVQLLGLDARTGRQLWKRETGKWGPGAPADIFVIDGLAWTHDTPELALVGLDPKSGEVKRRFSIDAAFNETHHHRCYRDKATTRYLLTARRGIELLDLKDESCRKNPWVRGTCRFGIVPCNGLIYAPPHPCQCYIKDKLSGFFALAAPQAAPQEAANPLEKGPAFGTPLAAEADATADWPTYRGDIRRSGSTAADVPAELAVLWSADLGGGGSPSAPSAPTAPTVADGKVFAAAVDAHRVVALNAADGKPAWAFTAGGRVDSPPTFWRGLVLFGSADGWVYCLRAADGELAWRFRAAPQPRQIVACGQLESPWPVHGSVLVKDGVAYAAAGRSTHLDGGVHVCALDPATGRLIRELKPLQKDPDGLADVLVSDGKLVCMRHLVYSLDENAGKAVRPRTIVSSVGPRAYTTAGLLDDSFFSRVGWSMGEKQANSFELLVFDEDATYGVHAYTKGGFGGYMKPGTQGYQLVASRRGELKKLWSDMLPIRIRAMALAGKSLFVAGPPDVVDASDPWAAFEGEKGGVLAAVSAADGRILARQKLPAPPIYDGLAAAAGRLYVATTDGHVLCLAPPSTR